MTKTPQLPVLDAKQLHAVKGGMMSEAELQSTLPKGLQKKLN